MTVHARVGPHDPDPVLAAFAAASLGAAAGRIAVVGGGTGLERGAYAHAVREAALGLAATGAGTGTTVAVAAGEDPADRAVGVLAALSCGAAVAVGPAGADVVLDGAALTAARERGRARDGADPAAYEGLRDAVAPAATAVVSTAPGAGPITFRHLELAWAVRAVVEGLSLGSGDVVLTRLPARPGTELVLLLACATTGATWVAVEDDGDVVESVRQRSPSVVWAHAPAWLQLAAEHDVGPRRRSPLTAALHLPTRRRRAALGLGACRRAVVHGVADPETAATLADAGVPLAGSWGPAVALGVATVDDPTAPALGTVGRPLPGVDVAAGADGRLLVRANHAPGREWHETGVVGSVASDGRVRVGDGA